MGKIKTPLTVSNTQTLEELRRYSSQVFDLIVDTINGRISLSDNIQATIKSVTFSGSGVTVSVDHGLGITPSGYFVVGSSTGIIVFDGNKDSNGSQVYVQATGAGTAKILIFT